MANRLCTRAERLTRQTWISRKTSGPRRPERRTAGVQRCAPVRQRRERITRHREIPELKSDNACDADKLQRTRGHRLALTAILITRFCVTGAAIIHGSGHVGHRGRLIRRCHHVGMMGCGGRLRRRQGQARDRQQCHRKSNSKGNNCPRKLNHDFSISMSPTRVSSGCPCCCPNG